MTSKAKQAHTRSSSSWKRCGWSGPGKAWWRGLGVAEQTLYTG